MPSCPHGWLEVRAGRPEPQPAKLAASLLVAGTASGSLIVDREVAESWKGVVRVSGYAELGAEFSNSLLPRVAEAGGGPVQIDEFRPHGQPGAAVLEEMEAVRDGAYISLHGCVLRQVQASEGSRLRTAGGGQAPPAPPPALTQVRDTPQVTT